MSIESAGTAVYSLEKTCRTCLGLMDMESASLFEEIFVLGRRFKMKDILNTSFNVNIYLEDGLPFGICPTCMDRVMDMYVFRAQCQNSERTLREHFLGIKKKERKPRNSTKSVNDESDSNSGLDSDNSLDISDEEDNKRVTRQQNKRKFGKTADNKSKSKLSKSRRKTESDAQSNQIDDLQNQESMDTEPNSFICNVCGKGFEQQYALTLHMRTHSSEEPYVCMECGKSFSHEQELDAHLSEHGKARINNTCSECGMRFATLPTLTRHLWQDHSKGEDPEATNDMSETKNQESSVKKFAPEPKKVERVKKIIKYYTCNLCQATLDSDLLLKEHMRSHALQYVCEVCAEACTSQIQLAAHMRSHDDATKRHLCPEPGCGRTFNRADHAKSHYVHKHSNEKPFQCEVCSKAFCQRQALKIHMRTHTGERPYQCPHCDKAFIVTTQLNEHMKRHLGNKPFQCTVCPKSFYRFNDLNRHMPAHASKVLEKVPSSNEVDSQQNNNSTASNV